MPYQMKDLTGSMFTNQYKNQQDPNDRSPHFKGHVLINGVEWAVAGWWAYPQNGGQPYLQLKFEVPRQPQGQQPYQGQQQGYQQQSGYQQQPRPQYQQQPAPQQGYQPGYQPQPQPQAQPQYQQPAPAPAPQPQYQQPAAPGYPPQGGQPVDDLPFAGQQ